MKLVSFSRSGAECCGAVVGERVLDLQAASGGAVRPPMAAILASDDAMAATRELVARAGADAAFLDRHSLPLSEVNLLAPVPRPGKIMCVGLNYADHAAETGTAIPEWPVIFTKAPSAVIGHGASIIVPAVSEQIDYEVELGAIVGRPAKGVTAEEALDHVAGYTVLNDVSVRDYQKVKGGGQWPLGKSFDTHCPMGPCLVTPDEIGDPHDLELECVVSGETLQSSSTRHMMRGVGELIAHLCGGMTLEPGDVIATGTPPGVGVARRPPRWLRPGDVVECTVEKIGTLRNLVE